MESFMKQMRGGFFGAEQGKTEESSSIRNHRVPPRKTQKSREKRTQNWFQRPFSGKMTSLNDDSNHRPEQVLAVAAATYVINMIPEPSIQDQKKTTSGIQPSLIRDKSRKEEKSSSISKPGTISKQFPGEGLRKGSGSAERVTDCTDEKEIKPAPSFKKSLTFADHLGSSSITKQRSSSKPDMLSGETESATPKSDVSIIIPASTAPKLDHPVIKPGTAARRPEEPPTNKPGVPEIEAKRKSVENPKTEKRKAEASEKDEMVEIKERYRKLYSTILAWEEKNRKKAKNKLHRAESELERKRARALLKFKNEMDHIKQAADGARAQAEASQRNEELKAKEKAEVPKTCFCS